MGKQTLIRSTSIKKKKTGLGETKPKSAQKVAAATVAEKNITAKTANHKNQPETMQTDKYEPLPNQKEARLPIETGVIEPDANKNVAEKMMDNIKKNKAAIETSQTNAENASEPTFIINQETIDKKNEPHQPDLDRSNVVINYGSEVEMETSTATKKGIIISVAALLIIYALIISASVINERNYYVEATSTAVEVWQGRFAPLGVGKEPLITIQGVQPPSFVKKVYTRAEIFNFIFNHYLKSADAVIDQPGIPNVKKLDTYLKLAKQYADSEQNRQAAISRLNGLNQLFLLYKADIAMFKGTAPDLQIAADYLEKAIKLATNKNQKERIQRQRETVQRLTNELEKPRANVTENEKTPTDEIKPADQSPEKAKKVDVEKIEKNQAPVKSDTVEEKKDAKDSAALKEKKQAAQESENDKQAAAKTDIKEQKPVTVSE